MAGRPPLVKKDPAEGNDSLSSSEPSKVVTYKAQRDFMAYYKTQLVSFSRDQILEPRIGNFMYNNGAPIDIVEGD